VTRPYDDNDNNNDERRLPLGEKTKPTVTLWDSVCEGNREREGCVRAEWMGSS
jgi:hypothetical protein